MPQTLISYSFRCKLVWYRGGIVTYSYFTISCAAHIDFCIVGPGNVNIIFFVVPLLLQGIGTPVLMRLKDLQMTQSSRSDLAANNKVDLKIAERVNGNL